MTTPLTAIVASLIALTGLWLLNTIRRGVITGRLRYADSTTTVNRATQPLKYWSILVIQLAFAVILLGYAASAFLRLLSQ